MKFSRYLFAACIAASMFCPFLNAQQPSASASAVVPRLVNFSGKAIDAQGRIITGIAGITFAIYQEQADGVPLWMETQNVNADGKGNYTAQLGAASTEGLPLDLFTSGGARWLGVRVNGGEEQPRILLISVPYALKAADAETVGGLPPSAFVLATSAANATTAVAAAATTSSSTAPPPTTSDVTTSGGTVNTLPLWTTGTNIQSSSLTQTGSGSSAKVGINTATPATTLDVSGAETVRGNLSLPATGTATKTAGTNSQPTTLTASAFSSSTNAAVAQNFRWQAEASGNNTSSPSGTLNLLYSSGTSTPAETGLKINNKGLVTFGTGQTFPGGTVTGNETVQGNITASGQLTSTVATGTAPLSVKSTTQVANLNASFLGGLAASSFATLGAANIFTQNQTINGALTVSNPNYLTVLEQGPEAGIGTALEMQTTGSGGMSWQVLNTGTQASQGANKLNFRNDSAGTDVMTLTATGSVGVGTTSPGARLDVFAATNPGGPIAKLGSNGTSDSSSVQIYSGSGTAENFVAGCAGCFVPGTQVGDGGLRVSTGKNIVLGDSLTWRTTIDSAGNADQPHAAGGFVKAMLNVNAYQPPYSIVSCFNSALSGAAATTPPCGINFTELSAGLWNFDFGYTVSDRFFSATFIGGTTFATSILVYPWTTSSMSVFTSDGSGNGLGAGFWLIVY